MANKIPIVCSAGELEQLRSTDVLVDPLLQLPYAIDQVSFSNAEAGNLILGDICYYFGSGQVKKAKADAAATCSGILWVCLETIASAGTGRFKFFGSVNGLAVSNGAVYYLSPTTAGVMTVTVPTTAGHYIVKLGIATSLTGMIFKIERPILLS